jgi:hypothetical protein
MFSLFVTIIAIVLVVLLAAVTVYYGGSAYNNAQLNARVSTLISQGSQVKTAANAYAADNGGTVPSDITVLTSSSSAGQYLTAVPSNPLAPTGATGATASWNITGGTATVAYTSVQGICACEKFNEKYGGPPAADCAQDAAATKVPSCATLSESPGGTWAVNSPVCCQ